MLNLLLCQFSFIFITRQIESVKKEEGMATCEEIENICENTVCVIIHTPIVLLMKLTLIFRCSVLKKSYFFRLISSKIK